MKNKKSKYSRIYVELTAIWGNDDVSSSIKISRRRWAAIQEGAEFQKSTFAYYEGSKFSVSWEFINKEISIYAGDGIECFLEEPLSRLYSDVSILSI